MLAMKTKIFSTVRNCCRYIWHHRFLRVILVGISLFLLNAAAFEVYSVHVDSKTWYHSFASFSLSNDNEVSCKLPLLWKSPLEPFFEWFVLPGDICPRSHSTFTPQGLLQLDADSCEGGHFKLLLNPNFTMHKKEETVKKRIMALDHLWQQLELPPAEEEERILPSSTQQVQLTDEYHHLRVLCVGGNPSRVALTAVEGDDTIVWEDYHVRLSPIETQNALGRTKPVRAATTDDNDNDNDNGAGDLSQTETETETQSETQSESPQLNLIHLMYDTSSRYLFGHTMSGVLGEVMKYASGTDDAPWEVFHFPRYAVTGKRTYPNVRAMLYGDSPDYPVGDPAAGTSIFNKFLDLGAVVYYGLTECSNYWDDFWYEAPKPAIHHHVIEPFCHPSYRGVASGGRCLGDKTAASVMFESLRSASALYLQEQRRLYAFVSVQEGHDDGAGYNIQVADQHSADYINFLHSLGVMEDTALIINSDHGSSSGLSYGLSGFRARDHANPFLALVLPRVLLDRHPQVRKMLQANQQKLVTHYDVYLTSLEIATFPHVDRDYDPLYQQQDLANGQRQLAYSLLREVIPDDRGCEEAAIPRHYCYCNTWMAPGWIREFPRKVDLWLKEKVGIKISFQFDNLF
jgi:hypothetical protein